jgi:hypothetical protein
MNFGWILLEMSQICLEGIFSMELFVFQLCRIPFAASALDVVIPSNFH